MLQAYLKISGHLVVTDALHTVEVLPPGNDPCLVHHCFPATGN